MLVTHTQVFRCMNYVTGHEYNVNNRCLFIHSELWNYIILYL